MATIQGNFEQTREYKKGMIGESIVRNDLQSKGYQIMQFEKGEAHPFDMFCFNKKTQKHFLVEVKTKSRMKHYNMTGISVRHFSQYSAYIDKNSIDFWLFFVDHITGVIEAGKLQELRLLTMERHGGSVVWDRDFLRPIRRLTKDERMAIEQVSVGEFDFKPIQQKQAKQLFLSLTS
jgi:hypothetical protein